MAELFAHIPPPTKHAIIGAAVLGGPDNCYLSAQIDEVARTLSFRQVTAQTQAKTKQISRTISDMQIERMEYALRTLRFVRDHKEKIEAVTGVKIP